MKLTTDLLIELGFRGEGKDITGMPVYRLEIPQGPLGWYGYGELQMSIGDYPETNPNSGIVSLYEKEEKDMHCLSSYKDTPKNRKKLARIDWEIDEHIGGIEYVTFPERMKPIASHVVTLERLNAIYTALTGNPPLEPRKI